ncbi:MAG: hypothetical protein U0X71_09395 [Sphingobacteriaceae bacterium]|jgi:hypothetical protein
MSFENTGYDGTFHAGPGRDFTTRNKPRSNDPFSDEENHLRFILKVKTAQAATNVRSRIQRRLDNDPFFRRNSKRHNSAAPNGQTIVIIKSPTLKDALFTMNGCIDLVISAAEAGVHTMQSVKLPKAMRVAGKWAGGLGILDNFIQFYQDPNWTDGTQMVAQAGLMIGATTLGAPIVLGGGLVLFVWELAE